MKRTLGVVLLMLGACRPDPGESDYENHQPSVQGDAGPNPEEEFLPGPFPYQQGQRRLFVGFYEGGRSEEIIINDVDSHIYLYEGTVSIASSTTRVEGKLSDRVVHAGKAWLGFGIHWDTPRSLDGWKTLHVSLQSSDPGFAAVKIGMNDTEGFQVDATKYGYANDGQWHHLAIPLADFAAGGVNLAAVQAPFVLLSGAGPSGNTLLLDNLYFTN
ncbi:putative glycoside hydrolase [Myxococcus faecalis]|uniref:putative glycoside hydrolase n=1 Tax=Myxococcus faecalis TaxID=3115646 RepID=UPI003CF8D936